MTARARRELLKQQAHWLEHGESKLVLIEDLEGAQELLINQPVLAVWSTHRGRAPRL